MTVCSEALDTSSCKVDTLEARFGSLRVNSFRSGFMMFDTDTCIRRPAVDAGGFV